MKKRIVLLFCLLVYDICTTLGQVTFPVNGIEESANPYLLLKNATIHVDSRTVIKGGEVLVYKGRIKEVGKNIPRSVIAVEKDLHGMHLYPAFIDVYSNYGLKEVKKTSENHSYYKTIFESGKKGSYAWNEAIKPETNAANQFMIQAEKALQLRKNGFGTVLSSPLDGIARGTGAVILLNEKSENESLYKIDASSGFSFNKGTSSQSYPYSLMGAVALLRQSFYDVQWYQSGGNQIERNLSLEALSRQAQLPLLFEARDVTEVFRAQKVAEEFGFNFIYKTQTDLYQRIDELKKTPATFVCELAFPKVPDVSDPLESDFISLSQLKHWELAPKNLSILAQNKVNFAITSYGLEKPEDFLPSLRKSVSNGLDSVSALQALTEVPAKILKIENEMGAIKKGLIANFFLSDKNILDEKAKVLSSWIKGAEYPIEDYSLLNINGSYEVSIKGAAVKKIKIEGESTKPTLEWAANDSTYTKGTISRSQNLLNIVIKDPTLGQIRLNGWVSAKDIEGKVYLSDGKELAWKAVKLVFDVSSKGSSKKDNSDTTTVGKVIYPFAAYGSERLPESEAFIVKNVMIWSNEKEGIFEGDVWIKNGEIFQVGKNLIASNIKTIDGRGKHLTNGIIDEHSHIALFSINDIQSVSSEVRMEDVLDPTDIDIYRQLAGGVTTSQLLHGSANCIGGQSAIIKLKWGHMPEHLLIPNAPKFIKFALGENVKRGNAGSAPDRYPVTRMGVEQTFYDAFTRAKNYKAQLQDYKNMKIKTGVTPPRKDLELDALIEILEDKRHITCHSYVQSEINMLMKLADSMDFRINTFTHILEGYKVADKMKTRNINASTFSDWWAYKMEVKEAIPFNVAILNRMGVNTAINSDDAEMARRLNQEAAKTILYGGLSEEEAWKTVTLNPAKMLRLDDRLGSIKAGKDADLVLWSGSPLSNFSHPEKTIIDGAVYFDVETDKLKRKEIEIEKNRIITRLLEEISKGTPTVKPTEKVKHHHIHCDTVLESGGRSVDEVLRIQHN